MPVEGFATTRNDNQPSHDREGTEPGGPVIDRLPDGVGVGRRGAKQGRVAVGDGLGGEVCALDAVAAEPAWGPAGVTPADEVSLIVGTGQQVGLHPPV